MKKNISISLLVLQFFILPSLSGERLGGEVSAQTFYDSTWTHIADTSAFCVPIIVSGLPNQINSSFGLTSVCFNITHTYDADLVIEVQSPDGSIITLAGGVGGAGQNFTNTCVAMNGANGFIATGTAPFIGIYIPQQSLNLLNNGQNPNGSWKFCINDTYMADTGALHNFSITFANNPPPDPSPPPIVCSYCTCLNNADSCDLLPDMTASALCIQQQHTETPGQLFMANATPNIGRGPIEIHGIDSCFCDTVPVPCSTTTCPSGNPVKHIIIQRVYQRVGSDTLTSYDSIAGHMNYHPSHGHLHIDDWSDYSLRLATTNPDATTWPLVGTSTKQSFCLVNLSNCTIDYGYCVDTSGNILDMAAVPNAGFGLYTGCGLDQGIYPGMLDIYDMSLNDPIILNNICDGTYYIVSITDPENNFIESNENNNWVSVPINLTQQLSPSGTTSFNYSVNGLQTTFTNTSPTGNTYLWNFGDGSWDTTYSPVHTYTAGGTYTVTLVSLNQCYTMTSQVIVLTGINEYNHADLNLHIYQNPITENSFITYYLPEKTNVKIELFDMLGKNASTPLSMTQPSGLQKYYLRNIPLEKGIYFLRLDVEGLGNSTVKIIKAR